MSLVSSKKWTKTSQPEISYLVSQFWQAVREIVGWQDWTNFRTIKILKTFAIFPWCYWPKMRLSVHLEGYQSPNSTSTKKFSIVHRKMEKTCHQTKTWQNSPLFEQGVGVLIEIVFMNQKHYFIWLFFIFTD